MRLLALLLAFSDPAHFDAAATAGGGAGRYFTGSPLDGYTCAVCHRGGEAPRVELEGVPARAEPGVRYVVALRWTDPASHALQLELLDAAGASPRIMLDLDALPAESRCEGASDGAPAAYLRELGERRILGVQDCGARALTFAFEVDEAGPLTLSGAIVRTDSSGTPAGDGVLELREEIGADATAGCSLGEGPRGVAGWLALALALLARRRAQRNSSESDTLLASANTRSRPTNAR
jgi:MYXO-CTERM domain-containing protein